VHLSVRKDDLFVVESVQVYLRVFPRRRMHLKAHALLHKKRSSC